MNNHSKIQVLLDAQKEQGELIAKHRITLLKAIDDLDAFGGQDDYKSNVLTIVHEFGSEGISLKQLREVLPNANELKVAVEQLENEGKITSEKQGKSAILRPTTIQL